MKCMHGQQSHKHCNHCAEDGGFPLETYLYILVKFRARHEGRCPTCNHRILKGQWINRWSDDRFTHEHCPR